MCTKPGSMEQQPDNCVAFILVITTMIITQAKGIFSTSGNESFSLLLNPEPGFCPLFYNSLFWLFCISSSILFTSSSVICSTDLQTPIRYVARFTFSVRLSTEISLFSISASRLSSSSKAWLYVMSGFMFWMDMLNCAVKFAVVQAGCDRFAGFNHLDALNGQPIDHCN